ncbi:MAG: hypothetical protein AB3N14_17820, partial [Flavobacteriaceae bacterium]
MSTKNTYNNNSGIGRFLIVYCLAIFWTHMTYGQDLVIKGELREHRSKEPIENAIVQLEGTNQKVASGKAGNFEIIVQLRGELVLLITAKDIIPKRLPMDLELNDSSLDLGVIFLD